MKNILFSVLTIAALSACNQKPDAPEVVYEAREDFDSTRLDIYASVKLSADLSQLTENEKQMIPLLIKAADLMDQIFWKQAFSRDKTDFLNHIEDEKLKNFAEINYGPWDRLNGDEAFLTSFYNKPLGANFYPTDMTKEEFEAWDDESKKSLYTVITKDHTGALKAVPYHLMYETQVKEASEYLKQAAGLAETEDLKSFLNARAEALLTDDYDPSDILWLQMKDNTLDVIIGPIETYEDALFGYKAAHEAYILVKDKTWSQRLEKYVQFLPELQKNLPVNNKYKQESPGSDAQLNAYDVIYYAGHSNAGSKTIAVNLPNDENLQLNYGTRRSQLKNAMKAKFDKILVPLADVLIAEDQRKHITFEAFFANTMFHEVAHGLGIKNTINERGTVREALKDQASALEEGKADILGLFMVTQLFNKGEIKEGELMDYYVTFMAGIFRSVRFGASSAHGKANMLRFNYFQEKGAFSYDSETQTYRVNEAEFKAAVESLSALILTLQGDGDYEGVTQLMEEKGNVSADLQASLDRLNEKGIPVDIVFEQGVDVLGLE